MSALAIAVASLGAAVSATAIVGSVAQVTEPARLKRRESFYREASAGVGLSDSDRKRLLNIRRQTLARLVARESVPLRRQRGDFALGAMALSAFGLAGSSFVTIFEDGYDQFLSDTGGFGWALVFVLVLMSIFLVLAVAAAVDVAVDRSAVREDFLAEAEAAIPEARGYLLNRAWQRDGFEIAMSVLLASASMLVGEGINLLSRDITEPSRETGWLLLITIIAFSGSSAALGTRRRRRS